MADGDRDSNASAPVADLSRRSVLRLVGAGAIGAGAARVIYEYTGFGTVTGTNLTEQRLGAIARRNLGPSPFALRLPNRRLVLDGRSIELRDETGERVDAVSIADGESVDSDRLEEPLSELAADLRAIDEGEFAFEFSGCDEFFQRLRDARPRPFTVAALRGRRFRRPSRETVRRFAGVDPSDPASLVTGLAEEFGERTHFDYTRLVAESVQENLLIGAVPIKERFREPTHLDAILDGTSGLYCYEYMLRSIEAFHAVAPHRQTVPVFGAIVLDPRHNHAYTGLASVVRENGEVRIPMTFLDYYYSTLFDNLGLQGRFGEGADAYNEYHRAANIHYRNIYGR